jgi:Bucentaur or craniofacial development
MDWNAHVNTQQDAAIKDELEANRRGGGYLEKVEFLKRVEERKDDALEASKSKRRRL